MFDRLQRSYDLTRECWALLQADRSLLVFPLLSGMAMIVIAGSFAVPLYPLLRLVGGVAHARTLSGAGYVALLAFYWVQYSVVIFFQTALVEVAMRRFDNQPATIGDGFARAIARLPIILGYALIAATVGTVLRVLARRVGFIGKIVIGLLGFAWTIATALVVPVLAAEDVGPLEAVSRSTALIRKAWGEDLIGNAGIGLVFGLVLFAAAIPLAILTVLAFAGGHVVSGALMVAVDVLVFALLVLAQSTLQGIYAAALYRYAIGDAATGGVDRSVLQQAFVAKS